MILCGNLYLINMKLRKKGILEILKNSKGVNNGRCKLSYETVEYIRNNYIPGDSVYGAKALSKKFNVAPQTISAVITGQNWR